MGDIDPQTQAWLKSLKLGKTFRSYADFENGYNFGVIFDKLNLSKGKKFKSSPDMACIFHNYKNVKDLLLEQFGVDFPINNIIYRTEDLLHTVRDECVQYSQAKKQSTLKAVTQKISTIQPQEKKMFQTREKEITMNSKLVMAQTEKSMPQKILQIEKKLEKFREEKTKHELLALEQRKAQIQYSRHMIQEHRQYELNKVRNNHAFVKAQEQRVYDVCAKTEQVKRLRIEKDEQFKKFMQDKKDNYVNSKKNDEIKHFSDGMQAFQLNCVRQGVELEHDPDKPPKVDEAQFNKVVVMQRIKSNIKKQENDKKERLKRENRKRVDAEQARIKSDAIWSENNLIDKYTKLTTANFTKNEDVYKERLAKKAESQTIKQKYKEKQFVDLPQYGGQEERQDEFRKNKIMYLKRDVQYLERKYQNRSSIAQEVIEALLDVTVACEDIFNEKNGLKYNEWKNVEKMFLDHVPRKATQSNSSHAYYSDNSADENSLNNYLRSENQWSLYRDKDTKIENVELAEFVNELIEISYPSQPLPPNNEIHINNLPLKTVFVGDRLTGKTTLTVKLAEKYGLTVIDPTSIIKEALDLAKPPPPEDPKKAAKKDAKKPEQQSPQKIALKQFGVQLLEKIESVQVASPEILVEAIKFRIKQLYRKKTEEQIISDFKEAKEKEQARFAQAMKEFEDAAKKPKKDSKKGAVQAPPDEPPSENPYFYTKGFVIDSYPLRDIENLKLLQKELNSYIQESERLNPKAEQIRANFSRVIPIPKRKVDPNLKDGTFDLIFQLRASSQSLETRNKGRKIDPQTQIVYHPEFNPIPTDVKGLAERLVEVQQIELKPEGCDLSSLERFYSVFGDNRTKTPAYQQIATSEKSIGDTAREVASIVQKRLVSKYDDLKDLEKTIAEKKQTQKKLNQQEQKDNGKDDGKEGEKEEKREQPNHINSEQVQDEFPSENLLPNESKKSIADKPIYQQTLPSQSLREIISSIPRQSGQQLVEKYKSAVHNYTQKLKESLRDMNEVRQGFSRSLLNVQKNFVSIIVRPDDKAGKILSFQENYNKLHSEQPNIVRDMQASKHLIDKLDELYDNIWDSLEAKKNEAVNERLSFIRSNWLNDQTRKIVETAKKMMQIELNFLVEQLFFLFAVNCARQGVSIDVMPEYLSLGIPPSDEPIFSSHPGDLTRSDRLERYLNQMRQCLNSVPKWSAKILTELVQLTIQKEKRRLEERILNIEKRTIERILEQKSYYNALVNKMDDWIIFGIKSENDFVYEIFKTIKKSIQEARKSSVKDIHVKPITEVHRPISELTLYHIPIVIESPLKKIPIFNFKVFLEEIRCMSNRSGKIEFKAFTNYFNKRRKSKLLDEYFFRLDYDTVHQYLVVDELINFKELALAMLLADVPVCDESQIFDYKKNLEERYGQGVEKLTIDKFPLAGVSIKSPEEYNILRHLIFQIFRDGYGDKLQINNYIDTLMVFNQLQVLKYGDSIMMLMEDHMVHHH